MLYAELLQGLNYKVLLILNCFTSMKYLSFIYFYSKSSSILLCGISLPYTFRFWYHDVLLSLYLYFCFNLFNLKVIYLNCTQQLERRRKQEGAGRSGQVWSHPGHVTAVKESMVHAPALEGATHISSYQS